MQNPIPRNGKSQHQETENTKATKFATILGAAKYSQKVLKLLPIPLEELMNIPDLGEFFQKVSDLLNVETAQISNTYSNFHQLHRTLPDYHTLYKDDPQYPDLLRQTAHPPFFLFCQGDLDLFHKKTIAVVGTRNPTELGVRRAQKLSMLLSASGFAVVSGLARGIDTAAHTGAIRAGGKTIAVIGTPLNQYYPKENQELQNKIASSHLLVSQFHLGHPVTRASFPTRNYTMSGVSLATVVIEAGETSGALIQARQCMAQKRHLFILKNLLERSDLKWPRRFAAQGAFVINQVEDVMEELGKRPEYRLDSRREDSLIF
jgi:DNA processing protein